MSSFADVSDWIFDNARRLFFPEELLRLDSSLSKTELVTLIFVERKGDLTMSSLAEHLDVRMSTATGIVDRLVKEKYLERERNDADRRIVTVRLSDKGKSMIGGLKERLTGYIDAVRDALSEEELGHLVALAVKIISAIETKSLGELMAEERTQALRKIAIS
jgi:DNA-binding MarR family transcriptional regulator